MNILTEMVAVFSLLIHCTDPSTMTQIFQSDNHPIPINNTDPFSKDNKKER